jgi:hypothetical protein
LLPKLFMSNTSEKCCNMNVPNQRWYRNAGSYSARSLLQRQFDNHKAPIHCAALITAYHYVFVCLLTTTEPSSGGSGVSSGTYFLLTTQARPLLTPWSRAPQKSYHFPKVEIGDLQSLAATEPDHRHAPAIGAEHDKVGV